MANESWWCVECLDCSHCGHSHEGCHDIYGVPEVSGGALVIKKNNKIIKAWGPKGWRELHPKDDPGD